RLADGEIGQHLAIDRDPGLAEAVDKSTVGQPERPHRGIETLDPQRAEGALFALAVAIGVLVGALDRLLGDADRVLAPAVVALRGLADFLVAGVGSDAALDPSHGRSLLRASKMPGRSAVGQPILLHNVAVGLEHDARAAVVADLLGGPLDHAVALARVRGQHLAGAGDLEALLGAGLGLHLGHLGHLLDRPETGARARITAMLAQDSAERLRRHGSPLAGRRKARLYGRSGP